MVSVDGKKRRGMGQPVQHMVPRVDVDDEDNVIVTEIRNKRLHKITPDGTVRT